MTSQYCRKSEKGHLSNQNVHFPIIVLSKDLFQSKYFHVTFNLIGHHTSDSAWTCKLGNMGINPFCFYRMENMLVKGGGGLGQEKGKVSV